MQHTKEPLPQSETEWLDTGKFTINITSILGNQIRYAITHSANPHSLVTMVGGIPRDPDRRSKLPLINKLYGLIATELVDYDVNSVLYNQPATGGSSGDWDSETITTRSQTLVNLIKHTGSLKRCPQHTLIGSSAGAYIAVKAIDLLEEDKNEIGKLLLISPAAYPFAVENEPYGGSFTKIIRTPWDVADSPIFSRLERFVSSGGSLLISFFEFDDPPIPRHIQHYYCEFARRLIAQNHNVHIITIPGVAHNFRKTTISGKGTIVDNDSVRSTSKKIIDFLL